MKMADSDSLPEGWIVEVKVRNHGRKDKYYIDPTRVHTFQSRRDALRYSQTGELGKYVKSKGKDITVGEMENDKASSAVVEGQKLAGNSTKTELSQNQVFNLEETIQNEKTCEPTTEKSSKGKQSSGTSCPRQSEVGTLKRNGQKGESQTMPNSATGPLAEEILSDSSGLSKSKRMKLAGLPRRFSKRLAGTKIDQSLETKTKNGGLPSLASHLDEMLLDPKKHANSPRRGSHLPMLINQTEETGGNLTGNEEESVGKSKTKDITNKQKKREVQDNIKKQSKQKSTDLPRRFSKRLAGVDIGPQLEYRTPTRPSRISAESSHESKDCSASNVRSTCEVQESSTVVVSAETNLFIPAGANKAVEETRLPAEALLKEIWMDPCLEFAVKTLIGVIPIEDHHLKVDKIPQPSTNPPFSKCAWEEDPCFEFAVKTLIGDIEIEDYPRNCK